MGTDNDVRHRVEELHSRYVRVIDDDRLEEWPTLSTPDGRYRIVTRENYDQKLPLPILDCRGRDMMHDRVTGLRRINVYEPHRYSHQTSGLSIEEISGDRIRCRSNYLVIRTMATGTMTVFSAGLYLDTIVRKNGDVFFGERIVVTDSRQVDTLLVIPL